METKEKRRICPVCDTATYKEKCPKDGAYTFLPPDEMRKEGELKRGEVFDEKLRIEECVGKGGMGVVYKATQLSMNRIVALKVLSGEFSEDLHQIKRFYREAMVTSSLSHPNTISIYDFGCTKDKCLYVVMEYLEGKPLSEVLVKEKLSIVRISNIALQILKSLAEAHENGVIHRDLKPQNIFLKKVHGEEDFVKVLDFGIARLQSKDTEESSLTKTGVVLGTPQYMSPEQAKGEKVDNRADIYSFGVILYEMLSGKRPFDGGTPLGILMKHITKEVPQIFETSKGEKIPDEILKILYKCLEKDREKRPLSAEEIIPVFKKYAFLEDEKFVPAEKTERDFSLQETVYIPKTPVHEVKILEEEKKIPSEIIFKEKKRKIFYIIPLIAIFVLIFAVLFIKMSKKEEESSVLFSKPEIYEKGEIEKAIPAIEIKEIEEKEVIEEKEIFEEEISVVVPEKKEEKIPEKPIKKIIKKKQKREEYEKKW